MLMAAGPRAASEVLIKKSLVGVFTSDLTHKKLCVSHPHDNGELNPHAKLETDNWKLETGRTRQTGISKLGKLGELGELGYVARRGAAATARSLYV